MTKICTSLEQGKKLIESGIDKTTSDMHYDKDSLENYYCPIPLIGKFSAIHDQIPCWSLAALLNILPEPELIQTSEGKWLVRCWTKNRNPWSVGGYDKPIDACYEMIVNLNEQKLL